MGDHNKHIKRFAALILVLVLCISLFAGCTNDGWQGQLSSTKENIYISENGEYLTTSGTLITAVYDDVLYLADSNGNIHTVPFEYDFADQKTSFDGTKMIGIDTDHRLVYFDGTSLTLIAEAVYGASMSADGNVIAYRVRGDGESGTDLYRYADGKSTYIASGVIYDIVVSPDGSAIGYTAVSDESNYDSYYWVENGEISFVGHRKKIVGISNHAEYVYYEQFGEDTVEPDSFWVQSGSSDSFTQTCIDADGGYHTKVNFNCDGTEILFCGEDGYACISIKSGEPIRICERECGVMVPAGTRHSSVMGNIVYYDLDSFAENFFCPRPTYDAPAPTYPIVYVGENFDVYTVADHAIDYVYLCNDRKTCYYETDGALYKFDGSVPGETPAQMYEGRDFCIINNGRDILFFKDFSLYKADGTRPSSQPIVLEQSEHGLPLLAGIVTGKNEAELLYAYRGYGVFYQSGKEQSIQVYEHRTPGAPCVAGFRDFVYFCSGGNLYRVENGEPVKVEGVGICDYILADQHMIITFTGQDPYDYCAEVQNTYTYVGYYIPDYAGCYFSIDGVNFMPLVENYIPDNN